MNHTELINVLAERTGVEREDCEKVIRTFENILSEGFSEKRWKNLTFDMAVKMMNSIKSKKDAQKGSEDGTK